LSLLKKFLLGLKSVTQTPPENRPPISTAANSERIGRLVAQAQAFYPHGNPNRALTLFREAIALAPPAPSSRSMQERCDIGDIGFAIWAAWVCLDLLGRSAEEQTKFVDSIQHISPITAQRIRSRLADAERASRKQAEIDGACEILRSPQTVSNESLSAALSTIRTSATSDGAWWSLRDAAVLLGKSGYGDHAWSLFNAALIVAAERKGNLPSIYSAMGDLRKAEGMYQDAACQHLLAIQSSAGDPLKRSVDQLRICLKKAGAGTSAEQIRDALLRLGQASDSTSLIAELKLLLAAAQDSARTANPSARK
jgi:tetratricopeptide (TPR) repeat protein